MNKNLYIIGSCVLLLLVGYIGTAVFASDEIDDLTSQKELLTLRIDQTQQEYVLVAASKAEAQEFCNIVTAKETQLARLNQLNNSRRSEITLLDQKIKSLTQEPR